jgi:hypothetical protein
MQNALRLFLLTVDCSLLTACSVTPLTNKIAVGEEALVVAVGEGPDGMTDLFAAPAHGGAFVRLSYNRMVESAPRLSQAGEEVAYLRRSPGPAPRVEVVVLDLRNGAEKRGALPREAGAPVVVAWLGSDSRIAVRADSGLFGFAVPFTGAVPARLHGADSARADSALGVPLGTPVAAMVVPCDGGGLCVRTADAAVSRLDPAGRGAVRWGADSVGYFTAGGFEVRPLAGGRSRHPEWSEAPARLREITYAAPAGGTLPREVPPAR